MGDCSKSKHQFEVKNTSRMCSLCGAEKPEFTVTSKHIICYLQDLIRFNTNGTSHITKHVCKDCFVKIFDKEVAK